MTDDLDVSREDLTHKQIEVIEMIRQDPEATQKESGHNTCSSLKSCTPDPGHELDEPAVVCGGFFSEDQTEAIDTETPMRSSGRNVSRRSKKEGIE